MTRVNRCFLVCLLFVGEAVASIIYHQDLSVVLARETPVVRGVVRTVSVEPDVNEMRVTVRIDVLEVLRGSCGEQATLVHSFSTLLERRGADGRVVRVSPIREGSGIETQLQMGQPYFFVLDESGTGFLRAESMPSEAEIRELLIKGSTSR